MDTNVCESCLTLAAAIQKLPDGVLLMFCGLTTLMLLKKISAVLALGPVSQYLRILLPIASETRRNEPSGLTASPTALERFLNNTVT